MEKIPEDIMQYGVTNISMATSGGTLNAPRKRENMDKMVNIQTIGSYYPRKGKKKQIKNLIFISGAELTLN